MDASKKNPSRRLARKGGKYCIDSSVFLAIAIAISFSSLTKVSAQPVLTSLRAFDALRLQAGSVVTRQGNIDVVTNEKQEELGFCHLPALIPLSLIKVKDGISEMIPDNSAGSYQGVAAIALAAQHFNTGNGTIIPEVQNIDEGCKIRFTLEVFDTQLSKKDAVEHVIDLVDRKQGGEQLPCAFLGASFSSVSIPTSIFTGLKGYPQFSPRSTSSKLDDTDQFPLFGRLVPSDDGTAIAVVLHFQKLGVTHFGVIHTDDEYGVQYANSLQKAALGTDMKILTFRIPANRENATPEELRSAVTKLKESNYRYFFGVIHGNSHYVPVMEEAVSQGIAGTGMHNWYFADGVTATTLSLDQYEKYSPLYNATRGTGVIAVSAGGVGMDNTPVYETFARALRDLNNDEDLEYIKSNLPTYPENLSFDPLTVIDGFLDLAGPIAPFLYDTVIAFGLAACELTKSGTYFTGEEHFDQIVQTTFEGTSGNITLDPKTGTRVAESALFTLINFSEEVYEGTTGQATGDIGVVTDFFKNGEWINLKPYLYNDGSPDTPPDLPELEVDENYIPKALRVFSISMGAFIMLVSVGFACWTQIHSNHRVVKASQPIFLHIICIGTFLMGASIIPLTVDDQFSTIKGCDIACQAFPWLLLNGFVIAFSALYTKTHRVNKIMKQPSCKKIKVTPFDVMRPMLFFVLTNIIVLTLWTARNPITWERTVVATDEYGRPSETFGTCSYKDGLWYAIVLGVVHFSALVFAVYEAYQARDISTEFSESDYIMKALVSMMLVCSMGIPIIIIASEDQIAYLFVMTGICFVVCMSLLTLLFVPKVRFRIESLKKTRESVHVYSASNARFSLPSQPSARDFGMKITSRNQLQVQMKTDNENLRRNVKRLKYMNGGLTMRVETLENGRDPNLQAVLETYVSEASDEEESEEKFDPEQGATPEDIPYPDAAYPEPETNSFASGHGSDEHPNPDTSNPEPGTVHFASE